MPKVRKRPTRADKAALPKESKPVSKYAAKQYSPKLDPKPTKGVKQ